MSEKITISDESVPRLPAVPPGKQGANPTPPDRVQSTIHGRQVFPQAVDFFHRPGHVFDD